MGGVQSAAVESELPPFDVVADWIQQGRLLEDDMLRPSGTAEWRRLGDFRLNALHDPKGAVSAFQAAYYLDPHSPTSTSDLLTASRAAQGTTGAAPTP